MNNKDIALIGFPGCGKTTIGRILAEKVELPYYDLDFYIEKKHNANINEIFINGEEYFRKIESETLTEIVTEKRIKIISTGGGIVKVHKNMELLRANSIIFFINRPIEQIATDININTRPILSKNPSKMFDMYKERYPLYKKYCHYEIQNNRSINEVLYEILYVLR